MNTNKSTRQQQRKEQILETLEQTIERLQRLIRIVESQDRFPKEFSEKVKIFDEKSLALSSNYSNNIYAHLIKNKEALEAWNMSNQK